MCLVRPHLQVHVKLQDLHVEDLPVDFSAHFVKQVQPWYVMGALTYCTCWAQQ